MKIQLSTAKSNDEWPPVSSGRSGKTSALFPPTNMPNHRTKAEDIFPAVADTEPTEPKTFADIFKPFWDAEMEKVRSQPRVQQLYKQDGVDLTKYRDPKYGFFGETFACMLKNERSRLGRKEHEDAEKEA